MEKVKIVVVEDELIFGEELVENLESLGYEVYGPAISYTEGLNLIREVEPDLLLSDIQLSGKKTGIDLAKTVKNEMDIPLIFLTSFSDKETFELARENKPNAFLIKPYNLAQLFASIELAMDSFYGKKSASVLMVKTKECYVKLDIEDIRYIQSDHVYLDVFTIDKRYIIRQSMTEFADTYKKNFLRIHRSYLVNKKCITDIKDNVVLIDDLELPIGKIYADEVKEFAKKG